MTKQRPPSLSGKQRRHLRALGHHLHPVVQVGHQGLTDAVVAAVDEALDLHELVKVKVGQNSDEEADDAGEALETRLGCHAVQQVGRVLVVFREHEDPERRRIDLPRR